MKERIKYLTDQINHNSFLYYVLDEPEISDSEYDKLFQKLVNLENENPEFKSENSPTKRVGTTPISNFKKYTRTIPMLSLGNAFDESDIEKFNNQIEKSIVYAPLYVLESKFDGASLELEYENGELVLASTRGDGITGEIVTDNARTINTIPLNISVKKKTIVRGEVVIYKKDFDKINDDRIKEGKEAFSNPRNAASGSLRQLKSEVTARRRLVFMAYSCLIVDDKETFCTQDGALRFLKEEGFKIGEYELASTVENLNDFYKKTIENRENLEFDIDGVVVKVNDFDHQEKIGFRSRSPKWAIAWKLPAKEVTTKLNSVTFQIGKTGILTPVAELEPVMIDGVTISRATLHNKNEIINKDIRIGDSVFVCRSGDVIPKITKSIKSKRTGNETVIEFPSICPSCNEHLVHEETFVKCINDSCKAQFTEKLKHFVSKNAFNIIGLGDKIINQLVNSGLVLDYYELFLLNEEILKQLDGFQTKSAKKIINSINERSTISLDRLLYSLNIPHVGRTMSKVFMETFKTIDNVLDCTKDELIAIEGMGEKSAIDVWQWLYDNFKTTINNLLEYVTIEKVEEKIVTDNWINGKSFVITGTLSQPRKYYEEIIYNQGGIVKSGVSKKVDFVLCGDKAGSKKTKAEKFGIEILDSVNVDKLFN